MSEGIWTAIITGISTGLIILLVEYRTGWFASRTKKELSYEIISSTPIATVSEDMKEKIVILVNGVAVEDVTSLVLRIKNTGKGTITTTDFDGDIQITAMGSNILEYKVIETKPATLKPSIGVALTADPLPPHGEDPYDMFPVSVAPLLLNPTDSFTISLLIARYAGGLAVNARIAGVKEVKLIDLARKTLRPVRILVRSTGVLLMLSLVMELIMSPDFTSSPLGWMAFVMGLIVIVIVEFI